MSSASFPAFLVQRRWRLAIAWGLLLVTALSFGVVFAAVPYSRTGFAALWVIGATLATLCAYGLACFIVDKVTETPEMRAEQKRLEKERWAAEATRVASPSSKLFDDLFSLAGALIGILLTIAVGLFVIAGIVGLLLIGIRAL